MAIAAINPATGETLRTFSPMTGTEVDCKIDLAAETFRKFWQLSFNERGRMMLKAAEILEAEKNEVGKLMTTEMGKTYRSAVDVAVKCAWALPLLCGKCRALSGG